ncbi:hypothetical protein [uncultured Maritimibacter sp.]|uniref:hypothetical protein n=1 Tax=uncultured Maritimibacter sp. TaxID=991866 RepID=UPI0025969F85|nr:hypothetical protein [uncultured Maritimibacter sp.]
MSTFDVVEMTLASDVADAGTFTVSYPSTRDAGDYQGGHDHMVISNAYGELKATAGEVSLSFGASSITVTNNAGVTLLAGTKVFVQLDRIGADSEISVIASPGSMSPADLFVINLGAPDVADPDGVCEAQSDTGAHTLTLDGALVSGGVATFDVPRNIVIDSGGADTAVLTITGTDEYGVTIVENITLNGTTAVAGKKAFKTVTSVTSSATISNGAFVGTGDVFGLPVYLPQTGLVLAELEDGAAATAGTIVAGVTTAATATTGDVRGTYDPNSAADGSAAFTLVCAIPDSSAKGVAQYGG